MKGIEIYFEGGSLLSVPEWVQDWVWYSEPILDVVIGPAPLPWLDKCCGIMAERKEYTEFAGFSDDEIRELATKGIFVQHLAKFIRGVWEEQTDPARRRGVEFIYDEVVAATNDYLLTGPQA